MVPEPPEIGDDWVGLCADQLDAGAAASWATLPGCGGVVTFLGTVRDHSEGRPDVSRLTYEAYDEEVAPCLDAVAAEVRRRWPSVARIVLLHRVGGLGVGEVSVLVTVSAPHRAAAFDGARFAIDTIKATVPIWKLETWAGGEAWSDCAHPVSPVTTAVSP